MSNDFKLGITGAIEPNITFLGGASKEVLREEVPDAYKDVDQVVEVCVKAGVSKKVAKMRPLGVVKG